MSKQSAQAYIDRLEESRGQWESRLPDWLIEQKRTAAETFAREGFPDPRNEEWKYTNVRPIAKKVFQPAAAGQAPVDASVVDDHKFAGQETLDLVFVNGIFREELSGTADLPEGVAVKNLARALEDSPEAVGKTLGSVVTYQDNSFAAFNTAFFEDGAFIELANNAVLETPIRLLFVSTAEAEPVVSHPRVVISAGTSSQASVIEQFVGQEGSGNFTNAVTEIRLAANARVEHYKLQEESTKAYHVVSIHVDQARDSHYACHNIALGARLARTDINPTLSEQGAHTFLNGLFMPQGRQHMDTHTRIHHAAAHTTSEEVYRGVLDGHGRGVFKGRVLVARDSQKIEAHQSNDNLLLSDNAEVDTKPELEIYADDVVCSHGATVGQLDEDALYYLRSRAVDKDLARDLLIFAFADEVVARIPLKPLREQLEQMIVGRLPDNEKLKEFV